MNDENISLTVNKAEFNAVMAALFFLQARAENSKQRKRIKTLRLKLMNQGYQTDTVEGLRNVILDLMKPFAEAK